MRQSHFAGKSHQDGSAEKSDQDGTDPEKGAGWPTLNMARE